MSKYTFKIDNILHWAKVTDNKIDFIKKGNEKITDPSEIAAALPETVALHLGDNIFFAGRLYNVQDDCFGVTEDEDVHIIDIPTESNKSKKVILYNGNVYAYASESGDKGNYKSKVDSVKSMKALDALITLDKSTSPIMKYNSYVFYVDPKTEKLICVTDPDKFSEVEVKLKPKAINFTVPENPHIKARTQIPSATAIRPVAPPNASFGQTEKYVPISIYRQFLEDIQKSVTRQLNMLDRY